jgi:hypothetical protein
LPFNQASCIRWQRSGDGQHSWIDVQADDSARAHAFGGHAGDDAGAACDIEHPLSGTWSRAVDQIDGLE